MINRKITEEIRVEVLPPIIQQVRDRNVAYITREEGGSIDSMMSVISSSWDEVTEFLAEIEIDPLTVSYIITAEGGLQPNRILDFCVEIPDDVELSGDFKRKTIPGGRYAVFTHYGPFTNKLGWINMNRMINWDDNGGTESYNHDGTFYYEYSDRSRYFSPLVDKS